MGYRARLIANGPLDAPEWFKEKYSDMYHVDNCGVSSKSEEKYYQNTYQDVEIFKDMQSTLSWYGTIEAVLLYQDGKVVVVDIRPHGIFAYEVKYSIGEIKAVYETLGMIEY